MPVMELSEVYHGAQEEKMCMLRNKFDDLRWKIEKKVSEEKREEAFMQFIKKCASFSDGTELLKYLVETLQKLEMKKIEDLAAKPEDNSMSFISLVIAWNVNDKEDMTE